MAIRSVAIVGKGALGLLYGSIIAKSFRHSLKVQGASAFDRGADNAQGDIRVEYVMDDARYARHKDEVVTVNGAPCTIATIPQSMATPVDLVMLAVKATGLDDALDTLECLVGPNTRIVSLLNGITSEERIAQRFGWKRTVISVAQGMDAVFIDGKLTFSRAGEIRFGAGPGTDQSEVLDIAGFYEQVGIKHVVEADIRHRLWTKLLLNVGVNQTCMAYGGNYGSASEPGSEQNRCFIAAMRETLAVAQAEGVAVTEADLTQMAQLAASLDPAGLPSMAQDRINKKQTEVDEFAGVVIRLADKHGILVPQNRWLYARIKDIEAHYADAQ